MKLIRLQIEHYKMLRDVDMRFDRPGRLSMGAYAVDFLVGLNGAGKSTLLRAIAQIFTDLHANYPTPFNYTVEYELRPSEQPLHVEVRRQAADVTMVVHHPHESLPHYEGKPDTLFLPTRVVVYTTGSLDAWQSLAALPLSPREQTNAQPTILEDAAARYIAEMPGHLPPLEHQPVSDEFQTPLLLLRSSRLALIALTGLLASIASNDRAPLDSVLQSLDLVNLRAFSLRLRLHSALSDYDLYEKLRPHATRHVQQGSDHLLYFELPPSQPQQSDFVNALWADFATPLDFFSVLDQLAEPIATGEPTIQQVNLFLERRLSTSEKEADVTRLLLFDWLSDGEQSFLGRMAMLAMLQAENCLILLDEPEVHFNDYWKREIVKLVDDIMRGHANHLIIVSHSSIALSDVPAAQVSVMARGEDGFSNIYPPRLRTLGTDPSEIMVVIFNTHLSTGAYAAELLRTAVEKGEKRQLEELLQQVGPGMWYFRLRQRLEALDAPPD